MRRHSNSEPQQLFWRDAALPFLEARAVQYGDALCYSRHWHETFSVGVITGGRSSYVNGQNVEVVEKGSLVVMNPGDVHACNPLPGPAWSYLMFYFDPAWFGRTQAELRGEADPAFRPYTRAAMHAPPLADAGEQLLRQFPLV